MQLRWGVPALAVVPLTILFLAAGAAASKWTVMVYMLADNELECFAIDNLVQLMKGMYTEPQAGCVFETCGGVCPSDLVQVGRKTEHGTRLLHGHGVIDDLIVLFIQM